MKKKRMSSMVQKWKQVAKDVEENKPQAKAKLLALEEGEIE